MPNEHTCMRTFASLNITLLTVHQSQLWITKVMLDFLAILSACLTSPGSQMLGQDISWYFTNSCSFTNDEFSSGKVTRSINHPLDKTIVL